MALVFYDEFDDSGQLKRDDAQRVTFQNRKGETASGVAFRPDADWTRGHIAIDGRRIDAALISIDQSKAHPGDRLRVVIFSTGSAKHNELGYWLFPIDRAQDWYVYDERVIGNSAEMLAFLSTRMQEQKQRFPDQPTP